jgi:hypothetical protein
VRDPSVSFIFLAPDFRRAVIDGHLVREGERLPGGDRLVAIHDTSVIVHKDGRRRRIEIPAVFPEPPARAPWVQSTPVIGRQHAEELAPLPRPMTSLPEEVSKRSRF